MVDENTAMRTIFVYFFLEKRSKNTAFLVLLHLIYTEEKKNSHVSIKNRSCPANSIDSRSPVIRKRKYIHKNEICIHSSNKYTLHAYDMLHPYDICSFAFSFVRCVHLCVFLYLYWFCFALLDHMRTQHIRPEA